MLTYVLRCSNSESRVAAYEVLVELANNCSENLSLICRELIQMHHQPNPELTNQWEVCQFDEIVVDYMM